MRKSSKLITAVAVAGLAFAGGTALTGTGLATTAPTTQFIGGQVSQSVTGATLSNVQYGFANETTKTAVDTVTLTFTGTDDGLAVEAVPSGGTGGTFNCGAISGGISECTYAATLEGELGYTDLTSLAVSVSESGI